MRAPHLARFSNTEDTLRNNPTVSLVVPVYNEEENILPLIQRIRNACDLLGQPYEVVFVDDGSKDGTFAVLEEIHRQDTRVRVIRFRKNSGQTAAMAVGFQYAKGTIIISMDGDLQNDPADIPRLLSKLEEGYDVVCGWRRDRHDKLLSRRIPSVIANWLIGKITGIPIRDNGCSLKAYRAEVIKRIPLYGELHRFIPAMSILTGARVTELVVRHHARQFGQSKYGMSRTWRVLSDLCLVKMLSGFAAKPALWFGILSVPAVLLGTVCLFRALILGSRGMVFLSLAFLGFFLAGHFLFLGTLGEMVLHTENFQPNKTLVKTTIRERHVL